MSGRISGCCSPTLQEDRSAIFGCKSSSSDFQTLRLRVLEGSTKDSSGVNGTAGRQWDFSPSDSEVVTESTPGVESSFFTDLASVSRFLETEFNAAVDEIASNDAPVAEAIQDALQNAGQLLARTDRFAASYMAEAQAMYYEAVPKLRRAIREARRQPLATQLGRIQGWIAELRESLSALLTSRQQAQGQLMYLSRCCEVMCDLSDNADGDVDQAAKVDSDSAAYKLCQAGQVQFSSSFAVWAALKATEARLKQMTIDIQDFRTQLLEVGRMKTLPQAYGNFCDRFEDFCMTAGQ